MTLITVTERLLILIPAYNEEKNISQVICGVQQVVPQADIVVVDDGSKDDTAQVAEAAGALTIKHPFNLCIGGAVQTGLKFAQQRGYDLVIRIDGDGQHDPNHIPLILSALCRQEADVVICSRFLNKVENSYIPLSRLIGIRFFAMLVSWLTGQTATDTTSGFMGMNRQAVDTLVTYMPQDYPEVESRLILHKCQLSTLEIPVCMQARIHGQSSINSRRSLYYAVKVSIALALTIMKDFSSKSKEVPYAYSYRATNYGRLLQPHFGRSDDSTHS